MRKYTYVFPLSGRAGAISLEYSSDTVETLRERVAGVAEDEAAVERLIKQNVVGHFIQLSTGEMVFQTGV